MKAQTEVVVIKTVIALFLATLISLAVWGVVYPPPLEDSQHRALLVFFDLTGSMNHGTKSDSAKKHLKDIFDSLAEGDTIVCHPIHAATMFDKEFFRGKCKKPFQLGFTRQNTCSDSLFQAAERKLDKLRTVRSLRDSTCISQSVVVIQRFLEKFADSGFEPEIYYISDMKEEGCQMDTLGIDSLIAPKGRMSTESLNIKISHVSTVDERNSPEQVRKKWERFFKRYIPRLKLDIK